MLIPRKNESALKNDEFKIFFDIAKEKIKYASIWEIKGLSTEEDYEIIKVLKKYERMNIRFDFNFSIKDSSKLYCSEFVNDVLKSVNPEKFDFPLERKKLTSFQRKLLSKDTLFYYPVDIFQYKPNIEQIREWHFK